MRNPIFTSNVKMPMKLKTKDDGSGTGGAEDEAVKVPDCELVMLLPELKSAGWHVPLGQKNSWIFCGVGATGTPPTRIWLVKNSEKPPL